MRLRSQFYNRAILQSWFGLGGTQEVLEGPGKAGTEAVVGRLMAGDSSQLNTGFISSHWPLLNLFVFVVAWSRPHFFLLRGISSVPKIGTGR